MKNVDDFGIKLSSIKERSKQLFFYGLNAMNHECHEMENCGYVCFQCMFLALNFCWFSHPIYCCYTGIGTCCYRRSSRTKRILDVYEKYEEITSKKSPFSSSKLKKMSQDNKEEI